MLEHIRRQSGVKRLIGKDERAIEVHCMIDELGTMSTLFPIDAHDRVRFVVIDAVQGRLATTEIDQSSDCVLLNCFLVSTGHEIANQARCDTDLFRITGRSPSVIDPHEFARLPGALALHAVWFPHRGMAFPEAAGLRGASLTG